MQSRLESISNFNMNSAKIKRQRTAPPVTSINNLSTDNLELVAEFLPKTSRALFAVALTAPSSSWRRLGWKGMPSNASKAIINSSSVETVPNDQFSSLVDFLYAQMIKVMTELEISS